MKTEDTQKDSSIGDRTLHHTLTRPHTANSTTKKNSRDSKGSKDCIKRLESFRKRRTPLEKGYVSLSVTLDQINLSKLASPESINQVPTVVE